MSRAFPECTLSPRAAQHVPLSPVLLSPGAALTEAALTSAALTSAALSGAALTEAALTSAALTRCRPHHAGAKKKARAPGQRALFPQWRLIVSPY